MTPIWHQTSAQQIPIWKIRMSRQLAIPVHVKVSHSYCMLWFSSSSDAPLQQHDQRCLCSLAQLTTFFSPKCLSSLLVGLPNWNLIFFKFRCLPCHPFLKLLSDHTMATSISILYTRLKLLVALRWLTELPCLHVSNLLSMGLPWTMKIRSHFGSSLHVYPFSAMPVALWI